MKFRTRASRRTKQSNDWESAGAKRRFFFLVKSDRTKDLNILLLLFLTWPPAAKITGWLWPECPGKVAKNIGIRFESESVGASKKGERWLEPTSFQTTRSSCI